MGEPSYIVVTLGGNENLRLMLEATERLGIDNAVTVTLKGSAYGTRLFISETASGLLAFYGVRREAFLPFFSELANIKLANHFLNYVGNISWLILDFQSLFYPGNYLSGLVNHIGVY